MTIVYVFQMAVRNILPRLCKPLTEARYVDNIHCMLGNISSFCHLLIFFQVKLPNALFQMLSQYYTDWIQIKTNLYLALNMVQAVCKDYQQKTSGHLQGNSNVSNLLITEILKRPPQLCSR